ncbi:hypothetical protein ACA910_009852 [Epithemia clementina (nom. ined.)]
MRRTRRIRIHLHAVLPPITTTTTTLGDSRQENSSSSDDDDDDDDRSKQNDYDQTSNTNLSVGQQWKLLHPSLLPNWFQPPPKDKTEEDGSTHCETPDSSVPPPRSPGNNNTAHNNNNDSTNWNSNNKNNNNNHHESNKEQEQPPKETPQPQNSRPEIYKVNQKATVVVVEDPPKTVVAVQNPQQTVLLVEDPQKAEVAMEATAISSTTCSTISSALSNCSTATEAPGYSPDIAALLATVANASYHDLSEFPQVLMGHEEDLAFGRGDLVELGATNPLACIVARSQLLLTQQGHVLIVSFRGTEQLNLMNWGTNLKSGIGLWDLRPATTTPAETEATTPEPLRNNNSLSSLLSFLSSKPKRFKEDRIFVHQGILSNFEAIWHGSRGILAHILDPRLIRMPNVGEWGPDDPMASGSVSDSELKIEDNDNTSNSNEKSADISTINAPPDNSTSSITGTTDSFEVQKIFLTGHSLGGAMAVLAGLYLAQAQPQLFTEKVRGIYTYGQPMVIHPRSRQVCQDLIGHVLFRHVFHNDMITQMPSITMGLFAHFGHEYRYRPPRPKRTRNIPPHRHQDQPEDGSDNDDGRDGDNTIGGWTKTPPGQHASQLLNGIETIPFVLGDGFISTFYSRNNDSTSSNDCDDRPLHHHLNLHLLKSPWSLADHSSLAYMDTLLQCSTPKARRDGISSINSNATAYSEE